MKTANVINLFPGAENECLEPEFVSPQIQQSTAPAKARLDALSDEQREIAMALKRNGITKLYGIFKARDWHSATIGAGLYLMNASGWSVADMSRLRADAQKMYKQDKDEPLPWPIRWMFPSAERCALRRHNRGNDLFKFLFPNMSGLVPETSDTTRIRVHFPEPGQNDRIAMHAARLAGFTVGIAAPIRALKINITDVLTDLQLHTRRYAQRLREEEIARINSDPIVFATDNVHTAVLGHYNASLLDSAEMRSLVATLDNMAFDL